ncbi:hypothetical protein GGR51DRAFT_567111 [Nemania sp. FL0031]|nr:hypothetical protein GGR51DRAFT_567111 [Nemania sp. FL0031]
MDVENSRRSACDRCRGQKLRCVRLGTTQSGDDPTLEPCERCVKAGAECISSLPTLRKTTKDGRSSNVGPLSRPQSDHTSLQPLFPKNTPYSEAIGGNSVVVHERPLADNTQRTPPSESDYHTRTEIQDQCHPRSRKRRLTDGSHTGFGVYGFDDTHSFSLGSADPVPFGTDKDPAFLRNGSPIIDLTGFSLSPIPKSCAKLGDAPLMMDVLFEQVSSAGGGASIIVPDTSMEDASSSTENKTTASREDHLHRLLELNSRILRDFKGVNSIAAADIVSNLTRCETGNPTCTMEPLVPSSPIGRVLEGSQVFLELLHSMRPEVYPYAESECSYSEFSDESELSRLSSKDPSFYDMATRDSTAYRNQNIMTPVSQQPGSSPSVDTTMTLNILTCYTLLLQTYETIFSKIQEALLTNEKLFGSLIPPVLPGLHIGGFYLNKHRDLQMEILMSISCKMLERIEEVLGISVISEPQDPALNPISQRRGLLDSSCASALLDVLFKQMKTPQSKNPGGERFAMVKQTMESIRHVIKKKH